MRRPCCHSFLAFILKFLNLFQLFVGISIVLYSAYMLNRWHKQLPDSSESVSTIFNTDKVPDHMIQLKFVDDLISGSYGEGPELASTSPWFIYAFMGVGVTLCFISCTGHIAAEAINGCCLCFYTLVKTVFILVEVALVLFIALDSHWERDLPSDPTGEIDRFREFFEADVEFCKWVGITVVIVQVVCLLLAVVLRAIVTSEMKDDENDIEKDSDVRGKRKAWEPLLNHPRLTQTSVSVSGDGKAFRSDIWSSRMREKYGLSNSNVK